MRHCYFLMLLPYRKGSVVADIVLTFSRFLGESEVAALLSKAASDDKIGELPVSRVVTGEFIKPKDESEECGALFKGDDCKEGMSAILDILLQIICLKKRFKGEDKVIQLKNHIIKSYYLSLNHIAQPLKSSVNCFL